MVYLIRIVTQKRNVTTAEAHRQAAHEDLYYLSVMQTIEHKCRIMYLLPHLFTGCFPNKIHWSVDIFGCPTVRAMSKLTTLTNQGLETSHWVRASDAILECIAHFVRAMKVMFSWKWWVCTFMWDNKRRTGICFVCDGHCWRHWRRCALPQS